MQNYQDYEGHEITAPLQNYLFQSFTINEQQAYFDSAHYALKQIQQNVVEVTFFDSCFTSILESQIMRGVASVKDVRVIVKENMRKVITFGVSGEISLYTGKKNENQHLQMDRLQLRKTIQLNHIRFVSISPPISLNQKCCDLIVAATSDQRYFLVIVKTSKISQQKTDILQITELTPNSTNLISALFSKGKSLFGLNNPTPKPFLIYPFLFEEAIREKSSNQIKSQEDKIINDCFRVLILKNTTIELKIVNLSFNEEESSTIRNKNSLDLDTPNLISNLQTQKIHSCLFIKSSEKQINLILALENTAIVPSTINILSIAYDLGNQNARKNTLISNISSRKFVMTSIENRIFYKIERLDEISEIHELINQQKDFSILQVQGSCRFSRLTDALYVVTSMQVIQLVKIQNQSEMMDQSNPHFIQNQFADIGHSFQKKIQNCIKKEVNREQLKHLYVEKQKNLEEFMNYLVNKHADRLDKYSDILKEIKTTLLCLKILEIICCGCSTKTLKYLFDLSKFNNLLVQSEIDDLKAFLDEVRNCQEFQVLARMISQIYTKFIQKQKTRTFKHIVTENLEKFTTNFLGSLINEENSAYHFIQKQIFESTLNYISYNPSIYNYFLKVGEEEFLKKTILHSSNQSYFISLCCHTNLLNNQEIKTYAKRYINKSPEQKQTMVYKILDQYFSVNKKVKTLAILEGLQDFVTEVRGYLTKKYPKLAPLLILKMKSREADKNELIQLTKSLKNAENAHTLLQTVVDLDELTNKATMIVTEICMTLKLPYMDVGTFFQKINSNQLKDALIPKYLWNRLKESQFNPSPTLEEKYAKLEKKVKFV